MNITVYCGAHYGNDPAYAACARSLGAWIAASGYALVYGGGRVGLMGIVADAALAGGGKVYGVIPRFLVERETEHCGLTKLTVVETMAERKRIMLEQGDAYVALPGGSGTLEEISEVISLIRLNRLQKPCILFNACGFYDPLKLQLERMERDGFYKRNRFSVCFADSLEAMHSYLIGWYMQDICGVSAS
ncbi:MAG: TIGR00730 family Rossman fold protein [Mailhella sp.]|nr:TIGR00730 family Rossman fold protein [Mailhella sp.]